MARPGEPEGPVLRFRDSDPDGRSDRAGTGVAGDQPNSSHDEGTSVVVLGNPQTSAEAPGTGEAWKVARDRLRRAEEDRLTSPGDRVRAVDLVDPVDVEGPGRPRTSSGSGPSRPRAAWFAASSATYASVSTTRLPRPSPRRCAPRPTSRGAPGRPSRSAVVERDGRGRDHRSASAADARAQSSLPRSHSGFPSTATVASPITIHERNGHLFAPPVRLVPSDPQGDGARLLVLDLRDPRVERRVEADRRRSRRCPSPSGPAWNARVELGLPLGVPDVRHLPGLRLPLASFDPAGAQVARAVRDGDPVRALLVDRDEDGSRRGDGHVRADGEVLGSSPSRRRPRGSDGGA